MKIIISEQKGKSLMNSIKLSLPKVNVKMTTQF
jgi:hypothetical protein